MNELIDTMVILIDYAIFIIQIHDTTEQNSDISRYFEYFIVRPEILKYSTQ